jgi:hypothetical protein
MGVARLGSLSDDSLSVRYNLMMLLSDFDFMHIDPLCAR